MLSLPNFKNYHLELLFNLFIDHNIKVLLKLWDNIIF